MYGNIDSFEIHIEGEGNDAFQTSPYPLPTINSKGSYVIYLRSKNDKKTENKFNKNFLITANYANETIEIPINDVNNSNECKENELGLSDGKNIGKAILPLFAFNLLKKYEQKDEDQLSEDDRKNAIELSLSSGVLCKLTGYVGISGDICPQIYSEDEEYYEKDCCCCCCDVDEECCMDSCDYDDGDDDDCNYECIEKCAAPAPRHSHFSNKFMENSDDDDVCDYECCDECAAPEKKETKNDDNLTMNLMRLQNFKGYWEDLNELNHLLNINVSHINGVNVDDKEIEKNCVATLIAIAALQTKAADERNVWIMIEQKAISWLTKALPNADIDKLINDAKSLI